MDTFECLEHKSTDKLTKISDVIYDPQAHSDRLDKFIAEIISCDKEKAKFLQKLFGYGLTGDTRHECMTILYGASTRNGKGTLCKSVLKILGSYGCTARLETLAQKINANSSQPTEDIARLAGVRFVNISEPGKGLVLNATQVKNLTGNDTINARFLHENSFDFKPLFKLYINTNYLPTINVSSNRVIIIPFERHFDESEQDKTLKKEFAKPAELFLKACAQISMIPRIICTSTTRSTTLEWTRVKATVSIVPVELREDLREEFVTRPISDINADVYKTVVKVKDRPLSVAAQHFLKFYAKTRNSQQVCDLEAVFKSSSL